MQNSAMGADGRIIREFESASGRGRANNIQRFTETEAGEAMHTMEAVTENSEFVNFWNNVLVPKFLKYRHILVGGLTQHSAKIMPSLEVAEGGRVVDVGCGCGYTTIELARRVGSSGSVMGIDCCEAFLDLRRGDAAAGLGNITFIGGDAQNYAFEPVHDFCFSRFGTMFFENPVAGLKNMRTALKPGGMATTIAWRTIDDNPWLGLPKEIVLRHLPPPGEDADTCGPGPFSMADQEMVTKQFEIAGYTDIRFERVDAPLMAGNTLDDAVAFQIALGPAGEVFREAGDEAAGKQDEIETALKSALQPYVTEEGVMLESSSWVISARNPE